MGCCEGKINIDYTYNDVENQLRTSISNLYITNLSINEFESLYLQIVGIEITEVSDSKWYSEDTYSRLLNNVYQRKVTDKSNVSSSSSSSQNTVVLSPNDKKMFPFYFFLQTIYLLKNKNNEKIELIKRGLKNYFNPLTVKNFKIFVYLYLSVNLKLVTSNFIEKNNIDSDDSRNLLNKIFTEENIRAFCGFYINSLNKVISKNKPFLKSSKEIDSEIIKSKDIKEFFKLNKLFLDGPELRKVFFNRYSFPESENINKDKINNNKLDISVNYNTNDMSFNNYQI